MAAAQNGRITGTVVPSTGSVGNSHCDADSPHGVDKLRHLHKPGTNFATAIGGTPATREELVFVAKGSGTIRSFHALLADTGTSTSIAFDLKKNGTSVLSAAVTITEADTDGATQDGTISSASFVAGDRLSISMTVTSSTGAVGAFAWAEVDENLG